MKKTNMERIYFKVSFLFKKDMPSFSIKDARKISSIFKKHIKKINMPYKNTAFVQCVGYDSKPRDYKEPIRDN